MNGFWCFMVGALVNVTFGVGMCIGAQIVRLKYDQHEDKPEDTTEEDS